MRVLDLFSGIGGFSLGLERAGMETVAFCEYDEKARQVLRKHWPDVPQYTDIRTLTKEQLDNDGIEDIGLICGGFPCQPFSVAGKQKGFKDDRDLWPEMYRLIAEIRPTWVIGENVAGFVRMGLDRTLANLEAEGYTAQTFIIPACAVGAFHRRDRVWIVAHTRSSRAKRLSSDDQDKKRRPEFGAESCGGGQAVAHTSSERGCGRNPKGEDANDAGQSSRCSGNDRSRVGAWLPEPAVGRVANGVPGRVDRLKQLGNAVVPQIPEMIGRAIMEAS